MGSKKKTTPGNTPLQMVARPIALKPSSSDYETYVRTTSQVMSVTSPASQKTNPNERFLSLVKSGS